VIGDSQIEKWPLEHCLHKDIENFCVDHNIGCVNAANHGFGPLEYRDRIMTIAPDYKPDMILIFYYAGNDLTDVMLRNDDIPRKPTRKVTYIESKKDIEQKDENREYRFSSDQPVMSSEKKESKLNKSKFSWEKFRKLGMDSTIIQYAKNRVYFPNKIGPTFVNPHILVMGSWHNNYLFDNTMIESSGSKYTWFRILKIYEDILSYANSIKAEVCFVVIPSTIQVDDSHYDFYRKITFKVSDKLKNANKPQELHKEFAEASGINFLDLLPHFKNHSNTAELYFENDDHLSEKGHMYAYDLVEEKILIPLLKQESGYVEKDREENFYRKYTRWAAESKMNEIKKNKKWFAGIQKKARTRDISVDSMLYIDAMYVLNRK